MRGCSEARSGPGTAALAHSAAPARPPAPLTNSGVGFLENAFLQSAEISSWDLQAGEAGPSPRITEVSSMLSKMLLSIKPALIQHLILFGKRFAIRAWKTACHEQTGNVLHLE